LPIFEDKNITFLLFANPEEESVDDLDDEELSEEEDLKDTQEKYSNHLLEFGIDNLSIDEEKTNAE